MRVKPNSLLKLNTEKRCEKQENSFKLVPHVPVHGCVPKISMQNTSNQWFIAVEIYWHLFSRFEHCCYSLQAFLWLPPPSFMFYAGTIALPDRPDAPCCTEASGILQWKPFGKGQVLWKNTCRWLDKPSVCYCLSRTDQSARAGQYISSVSWHDTRYCDRFWILLYGFMV